jgi:GAF domain-containing protein
MTVRDDYFKSFCKVSKAFGTVLRKDELLELVVKSALEAFNGKAACLYLTDEEKDEMVPVAQKGLSETYLQKGLTRGSRVKAVLQKEGYLVVKDATTDPRLDNQEVKKAEGIASILIAPIMVQEKVYGALVIYTASPRDFSSDEIDFLGALAEQGGMAVQQARLYERMRQDLTLFHDLASGINSSLDIEKILHILTADICEAFGMKGVNLRLLDKDTGTLKLVASYGLSEEFLGKGPVSADQSVVQALDGETVAIADARSDQRVQYREAMKKEGIVSMLVVPIKAREEVIGVMRLCSGVAREFPQDMLTLVDALAHQGALAIQNANLYRALQADKKSLEEDIWSHRLWF